MTRRPRRQRYLLVLEDRPPYPPHREVIQTFFWRRSAREAAKYTQIAHRDHLDKVVIQVEKVVRRIPRRERRGLDRDLASLDS